MQLFQPLSGRLRAVSPGSLFSATSTTQLWRHRPQARNMVRVTAVRCSRGERNLRQPFPPKRDVPLYEVPPSVLDLDAEDNPHMRPYDDAIEAEETAKWRDAYASIDALAERLEAFAQDADAAEMRMRAVAAVPNQWRVSDRDIWSAVLATGSTGNGLDIDSAHGEERLVMGELLSRNGISSRAASEPSSTVQFLLHRQTLVKSNTKSSTGKEKVEKVDEINGIRTLNDLRKALVTCQSLVEIRRLLSLATRTATGSTIVAHNSAIVANRLASLVPALDSSSDLATSHLSSAEQISTMLLNLDYSLAPRSLAMGQALCFVGLRAAAISGEPEAVRRFLHIGLVNGYFVRGSGGQQEETGEANSALLFALSLLRRALVEPTGPSGPVLRGTHSELFTLLTGQDLLSSRHTRPSQSVREASFRAALMAGVAANPPAATTAEKQAGLPTSSLLLGSAATLAERGLYLSVLAALGGVRTLWEELQQQKRMRSSGAVAGESTAGADADTLVMAVVRYAACTTADANPAKTRATTTERVHEATVRKGSSSMLDLQLIRAYEATIEAEQPSSVLRTLRQSAVPKPSSAPPNSIVIDDAFRARVIEAFSKETVEDAMEAVDALLA